LKILSDGSSIEIFEHLGRLYELRNFDGVSIPISQTSLTRRQYYKRLAQMIKMGLVARNKHGKYNLTYFGFLIYYHLRAIDNIVDHYWKIRAVEAMMNAVASKKLSEEEFQQVVERLIEDQVIKKLLLEETKPGSFLSKELSKLSFQVK
jgi:hypothetical protein